MAITSVPANAIDLNLDGRSAPEPGFHEHVPHADYMDWPAVGSTLLNIMVHRSPKHFHHALHVRPRATEALNFGTAVHHMVLEPWLTDRVVPRPVNPRTGVAFGFASRAVAEWRAMPENEGKVDLSEAEMDRARAMVDAVHHHHEAALLLGKVARERRELSLFSYDGTTGLPVKFRLDGDIPPSGDRPGITVDLKTAADLGYDTFQRAVEKYGYHIQAAHAHALLDSLGQERRMHAIIGVEKSPPYAVAVYWLDERYLRIGAAQRRAALDQIVYCVRKNEWPGYGQDQSMTLEPSTRLMHEVGIPEGATSV